ncbi:uncharacterized protein L3040_009608 [Drepanopeziza brunnea f. sp. 'multigermtubi']|uniref:uncharacterized protein n=1 Tax=Drepanopeziza brunnea f. sp. 'multigermtubi' TaxID=698441 RepID=UPI002394DA88|nr:hypothetical protein L3040_009608 [Drepanopeziza brunnea f. sp. 'multigermtubi']
MITYRQLNGQAIPVALLPTISAADLATPMGQQQLQQAATTLGFFYLDLTSSQPGILEGMVLRELEAVYALADEYFRQPDAVKRQDVRRDIPPGQSQDLGYQASACDESFEISSDEIAADPDNFSLPPILEPGRVAVHAFSVACDGLCLAMLHGLSPDLLACHRSGQPSASGLKFIAEPSLETAAEVGDYRHTDGGTLTMLFCREWGLQMQLPPSVDNNNNNNNNHSSGQFESETWAFIPPRRHCAVVNVADALEELSEHRFRSPVHRVTQPLDGQAQRYYLAYFLRPESAVKERMVDV